MGYTLAVCAEMVHLDLPVADRVRRLHEQGFAVEIWNWTRHDLDELAATGARFTSMTGYVDGNLTEPDGIEALLASAERSVAASRTLGTPHLNLHGTGLDGDGLPVVPVETVTPQMWLTAAETLRRVADLGEREGVVFTLENLNTAVDHPGTPFAAAADTATLVAAVDSPHLRMNLDLYHAQIGEGNLIDLLRRTVHLVAEVQVADVPGRCEPGTGEIRYPAVAAALSDLGFAGVVGMEAWASAGSDAAVEAFRAAFTV
jgi:hydroxypyruvate isomerase